jgi:hypothetical protein
VSWGAGGDRAQLARDLAVVILGQCCVSLVFFTKAPIKARIGITRGLAACTDGFCSSNHPHNYFFAGELASGLMRERPPCGKLRENGVHEDLQYGSDWRRIPGKTEAEGEANRQYPLPDKKVSVFSATTRQRTLSSGRCREYSIAVSQTLLPLPANKRTSSEYCLSS